MGTDLAFHRRESCQRLLTAILRSVMKNKGTVKLSVNDVFKKQTFTIGSEYAQLNVHQYFNYDTRLAMLSFTWRFGNTKVKPKTERQTGIEKEKKRIGEN